MNHCKKLFICPVLYLILTICDCVTCCRLKIRSSNSFFVQENNELQIQTI